MKTIAYLYWVVREYAAEGGKYEVWDNSNMGKTFPGEYTLLAESEVEFAVPEFNPRELAIRALDKEREKVIAESAQKIAKIDDKKQQLLALPQPVAA